MSFADFPEQERIVKLLQRSLERGRLAHAYLFTGGDLTTLEEMARTLAKTVNCVQPARSSAAGEALDCCDRCASCRRIEEAKHPDVHWVRPESKSRVITIDQMRELMRTIQLKPSEAACKIGVIVAADRLNIQAANAFLKTLEEPPPRSILILISTEPQRLLETIISRCLRVNFAGERSALADEKAQTWLTTFSQLAGTRQKGLLSRYQLLSILLKQLGEIKAEIEENLNARSPLKQYDEIDARLRDKWEDELTAAVESEYRRRRGDLLILFQLWLRDLWLHTLKMENSLVTFPSLAANSKAVAARISPREAIENLSVIEETQRLLGSNVQEALALEVGLLKLKL
jgi:DNA polymerase III subunit delta'